MDKIRTSELMEKMIINSQKSFIKAFCRTWEEYGLLDKDIDIMNKTVSDDILCKKGGRRIYLGIG